MSERRQITDDEFDRLRALYDALYRALPEDYRDTFFGFVPPLDDQPRPFTASVPLVEMPLPANDRYAPSRRS